MIERVLIVGLGSIGKRHARLLRRLLPSAEVAALRHASGAAVGDVDQCFHSQAEALAFKPQVAVLANPAPFHLESAMALADAGVHLLVEKPLAVSTAGVADLLSLCRRRQVVLMTGYNLRFLPSLNSFRESLLQGVIGRVLHVRAEVGQYLPGWRPDVDYRQSVTARAELGGGVLLELSHELDYLRWLFGEVAWVGAVVSKQSDLQLDVEDMVDLQLGFAGGGTAPPIASVSLDCFRHDATRSCVAIGEQGTLRWQARAGEVALFKAGGHDWQLLCKQAVDPDAPYLAQWQHFLACVAGSDSPRVSGEDGLAVLRIVDAARESARRGCIVELTGER